MLTVDNISCKRQNRYLFKNLSFTIGAGCILVIKGSNGSGKTTLLNIISKVKNADEGEILYNNQMVSSDNRKEYFSIIDFIEHKNPVKNELTVYENIKFWAEINNSKDSMEAALSFFDLNQYKHSLAKELSQGWKKKISLSRLMLSQSNIWLLDEPFANLDKDFKFKLVDMIKTKADNSGHIILTSHEDLQIENSIEIDIEDFKR